ncbi:MAG: phosphohydrolase [Pseudogulbenkiania sp.]|nr:phosphohydrolase [Pseudogulbenkiania sp.]
MSDHPDNKTKLHPLLLRVGQELPVDVYASNGLLLLKKGHYVLSGEQRDKLLNVGVGDKDAVEARVEREKRERTEALRKQEETQRPANSLLEMEFIGQRVQGLLSHGLAVAGLADSLHSVIQRLNELAAQQPDALLAAILLVPQRDHGSGQPLHAATLLAVLSRRLGLNEPQRHALTGAALTMNISVTLLHNQLAGANAAATPPQREALFTHPLLSSAILREAGIDDELWHTLVQQHHEERNGSGYPMRLKRDDTEPLAHLLHLVDVLTAQLSPSPGRSTEPAARIMAKLFQGGYGEFDPQYTALLIKEIGIYPPGSCVRLANGEIAVVTHRREKANEPRVAALRKADGPPYAEPLLRETRNSGFHIIEAVPLAQAGVRPGFLARLWKP